MGEEEKEGEKRGGIVVNSRLQKIAREWISRLQPERSPLESLCWSESGSRAIPELMLRKSKGEATLDWATASSDQNLPDALILPPSPTFLWASSERIAEFSNEQLIIVASENQLEHHHPIIPKYLHFPAQMSGLLPRQALKWALSTRFLDLVGKHRCMPWVEGGRWVLGVGGGG